jgi:glycosyltransferase involved in cell wall biosynthesis
MISALILSHNDEKTIAKTLESVRWCDECIVIDDFSTDKTVSIVKKFHGKVLIRHLAGDFASQRNFALKQAKGNWVFYVDSDEVVTDALQQEILRVVEDPNVTGYFLKRTDYFYGKSLRHGETAGVRLLRLAKQDAGSWIRSVHEVWKIKGPTATLSEPLLHYPHSNVAQFLDEINWYSTLNAKLLFTQKKHEPAWYVVSYPAAKFIVNYLLKRGYLDGMPGLIVALMMSFHSFLTRAKLQMLWRNNGDST